MLRTHMTFEVVASSREDLERRALGTLADYLGLPSDSVMNRCEVELNVSASRPDENGEIKYTATVHARIK
jgi:hypothetical protein